jgi:hypothetical protein
MPLKGVNGKELNLEKRYAEKKIAASTAQVR